MRLESLEPRRLFDVTVSEGDDATTPTPAADTGVTVTEGDDATTPTPAADTGVTVTEGDDATTPAADTGVTVTEGYPGFYEIRGTAEDDVIDVTIDMSAETFTLDGQTYHGVIYVMAYGFGGNDAIIINTANGPGRIGASVSAGEGHDTVMVACDGAIWGGGGNDELYLYDAFRGEAYGEDGNDYMHISGLTTDAEIRGGDGHDFIDCSANLYGVVVFGGMGNDTIFGSQYTDELYGEEGNDNLNGGGGNDVIYAWGGGVDIVTGGGADDIAYVDAQHDSVEAEFVYYV
jgi:Ca2+-binding RTX toxin-like protein